MENISNKLQSGIFGGSNIDNQNNKVSFLDSLKSIPFDGTGAALGASTVEELLNKKRTDAVNLANVLGGLKAEKTSSTTPISSLFSAGKTFNAVETKRDKFNKLLDSILNRTQ